MFHQYDPVGPDDMGGVGTELEPSPYELACQEYYQQRELEWQVKMRASFSMPIRLGVDVAGRTPFECYVVGWEPCQPLARAFQPRPARPYRAQRATALRRHCERWRRSCTIQKSHSTFIIEMVQSGCVFCL